MPRRHSEYIFSSYRRPHYLRRFLITLLVVLVVAVTGVLALNLVLRQQVQLTRETVTVTNLPADLEQWSILVFSDLHGQQLGAHQSAIRRVVSGMNVSSIVMTGDMLGPDGDTEALLDLVALLPSDKPKLLVLGDEDPEYLDATAHGSLSAKADWAVELEAAGVTILDEPLLFTRGSKGEARIWFVPEELYSLDLDSLEMRWQARWNTLSGLQTLTADEAAEKRVAEYQLSRVQRIREAKRQMKSTDIQIAVTHVPVTQEYMNTMNEWNGKGTVFSLRQASLILSGHYCAGQWRLPGLGAIHVPELGWWPEDSLLQGLSYLNGVPQYISPGLAASGYYPRQPGRFLNQPVVTRITLTAKMQ